MNNTSHERSAMHIKFLFIVFLVVSFSTFHFMQTDSHTSFHILDQQLLFVPLVLASFWFGIRAGVFTATAISILSILPMISTPAKEGFPLIMYTQIALYFSVAFLMGWLSDRQRNQQHNLLKNERINTLAKTASTLSFEVRDIVKSIEKTHRQAGGFKNISANDDFLAEIGRLRNLLEVLGQFTPSAEQVSLSTDLNKILQYSSVNCKEEARRKRVKLILEPDESGCPSLIPIETLTRIFDSLVSNAIDFSEQGQAVTLRSFRGGKNCTLEVIDAGPGITKENEEKLFTTFFTTKPDGYGLSLSSGRKVLRDLGGDLIYEMGKNGGAIFRMIIPRESQEIR